MGKLLRLLSEVSLSIDSKSTQEWLDRPDFATQSYLLNLAVHKARGGNLNTTWKQIHNKAVKLNLPPDLLSELKRAALTHKGD